MKAETLRKYGWKPIVSEAQAHQLLRHELKHHRRFQQKDPQRVWSFNNLLQIKQGNWYKFMKNRNNGFCSILIWVAPTEKE